MTSELTDLDRAIIGMERRRFRFAGSKVQAIRDELGLTDTAYFRRLGQLLDSPAALRHDPQTIGRLQRLRCERLQYRTARRAG